MKEKKKIKKIHFYLNNGYRYEGELITDEPDRITFIDNRTGKKMICFKANITTYFEGGDAQ